MPELNTNHLKKAMREKWYLTTDEIDAVFDNKEYFRTYFKQVIKKRAELGSVPEYPVDSTDIHAILFLSEFSETSIIPDLIECLKMNNDDLEMLYGDMITEDMWLPFAKLGYQWFDQLWNFVTDTAVNEYARSAAVSGVVDMHHFHPEVRDESAAFIERLIEHEDAFDIDMLAGILCECADSGLTELAGKAKEFTEKYEQQLGSLQYPMADADDIRNALHEGTRADYITGRSHDVYTINEQLRSVAKSMESQKSIDIGREEEEDEAENIISANLYKPERKIGRNDPCTCGSGKKYKKCCGA